MSVQIKIDNAVKKYGNNVIITSLDKGTQPFVVCDG